MTRTKAVKSLGIIGAGHLGMTLAQLARRAGFEVYIASSRPPSDLKLSVDVLAPGAVAASIEDTIRLGDIVILALPLVRFRELAADSLDGKLVIDAMNYWWEVDGGDIHDILAGQPSSSQAVQGYFAGAHVVKALSHIGYHDLFDSAQPDGHSGRVAFAIAGDAGDVQRVKDVIYRLGFDTLYIGGLERGRLLEPGEPGFGVSTSIEVLREMLPSDNPGVASGAKIKL